MRPTVSHVTFSLLTFSALALAARGVNASEECIYTSSTLEADYAKADAVFVAQVTGCAGFRLPENGRCPDELYSLDSVDVLKESVSSRDLGGVIKGSKTVVCGLVFRSGYWFLLFMDANGNPYPAASGRLGAADPNSTLTMERLQILNQYRDQKIEDLSKPWYFEDDGFSCRVTRNFNVIRPFHNIQSFIGGTLFFGYEYAQNDYFGQYRLLESRGPNGEYRLDVEPGAPESMSLHFEMIGISYGRNEVDFSVSFGDLTAVEGSVSIRIADREWPLQRRTITYRLGDSEPQTIVVEAADNDAADEILESMSQPTDVVISAVASGIQPELTDQSPMRFEIRTTRFRGSSKEFRACVDRSKTQANPALP